jgi:hypothetical protein
MKPDINVALLNAAQEIINRFSPLIDDEYEKSRLSSWGALILISAMKFNDSGSSLKQENADILDWLLKFTNLDEDDISKYGYKATSDIQDVSLMDADNQTLRGLLDREIVVLEGNGDTDALKASYLLMRSMHQRRKVSDLIGLLQESES